MNSIPAYCDSDSVRIVLLRAFVTHYCRICAVFDLVRGYLRLVDEINCVGALDYAGDALC